MAITDKIISFWKQVKLKSSDMFTLFRVGVGVKVPTHKLHVKDKTNPMKLEGVQSDTSSSTKFLVLDGSDVVKHSNSGGKTTEQVQDIVGAMFTSNTETRISATYEDGDGTIDLVVDDMTTDTNTNIANTNLTFTGSRTLNMDGGDLTLTQGTNIIFHASEFQVTDAGQSKIEIINTNNDAVGSILRFVKNKGAAGADNDVSGQIEFYADDDAQAQTLFARIQGVVKDASNGAEEGRLILSVASHDGELRPAITIESGAGEDQTLIYIGESTSQTIVGNSLAVSNTLQLSGGAESLRFETSSNNILDQNDAVVMTIVDGGITALVAAGDLDIGNHNFRAKSFTSDVATGTAPFTVSSTTAVANLQAATATILHTARNIGGVSFNGSANIDLPGVNSAGNQNTSGTANSATNVFITDNESTDEENQITFIEGAGGGGANRGIEADGDFTYNPSSGTVTCSEIRGTTTFVVRAASGAVTLAATGNAMIDVNGSVYLDSVQGNVYFRIGGTDQLHFDMDSVANAQIVQLQVNGDSLIFRQFDGKDVLHIDDTGYVGIKNGDTSAGELRIFEDSDDGTHYVGLTVAAMSGSQTYTLPTADGSDGQVLKTNGSGVLAWIDAASGSGDITGVTIQTDSGSGAKATDTDGSADFSLLGSSGVGITNSGATITAVAVPGEIDHNSLNNFVAAEHYRWDTDISSTATINAANIPTLNQNTTGTAATVTGAAQTSITSLGTLTNLDVDSVNINNKRIIITGDTDDTFDITSTTHGATTISTNDTAGANANLTFQVDGSALFSCSLFRTTTEDVTFQSSVSAHPTVSISNNAADATGGELVLINTRHSGSGVDGDVCGLIHFKGPNHDNSESAVFYASIVGSILESNDTDEAGKLELYVTTSNGSTSAPRTGLVLRGSDADNDVDVSIGNGTTSIVTVNGNLTVTSALTMGSTTAMTSAGLLSVANQSNITGLGTITSGVWNGTAIAHAYIGADAIEGDNIADNAINSEHYTDGSIDTDHIADDQVTLAKMAGLTRGSIIVGDASGNPSALAIGTNAYVLTSDGTDISWAEASGGGGSGDITAVVAGTGLNGGATSGSATLNIDAAQTGINSILATDLVLGEDAQTKIDFGTVNQIDMVADNTTVQTITSTTITNSVANFNITNGSNSSPSFTILNTSNDSSGSNFILKKDKGAAAADNDILGTISFVGDDSGQNVPFETYATIVGSIATAAHGSEGGKLTFNLASHDGETQPGLILTDGSAEDEIDVTIGNGSASVVTAAGRLTAGSIQIPNGSEYNGAMQFQTGSTCEFQDQNDNTLIAFSDDGITSLIAAGNLDIGAYQFRALSFQSDVATGTAPFVVASTTQVANLQSATATVLHTARNINGVSFNGSADITVTAAGSTLSDTVTVAKGGTGATSFADKSVIITQDSGTDTLSAVEMSSNGQLLIGGTSGPTAATLTAGSNVTITNADGGITIAASGGGGSVSGDTFASDLKIGRDADNLVDFATTDNEIVFRANAATQATLTSSGLDVPKRKISVTASGTHGDVNGDVIYIGTNNASDSNETVAGKIYYYHSDGSWRETDADFAASATGLLAVALGTDPDGDGMLLRGTATLSEEITGTEALGSILYLDTTPATATTAHPSGANDIVRIIGYALSVDNDQIWFNPSNDWVQHA